MVKTLNELYQRRIRKFLRRHFHKVAEINRKYATPRIPMTPAVRMILLVLRLYLLFLVGILFYKFFSLIK